jgi:hypothetical protein
MGYKSRGNYPVSVCLKKCANRDKRVQSRDVIKYTYCDLCIGSKTLFKPIKRRT